MTYYFSIFLPVREGGYAIFFPDFPEIASEGETVDECMVMAQDALSITVEEYAASFPRLRRWSRYRPWRRRSLRTKPWTLPGLRCSSFSARPTWI